MWKAAQKGDVEAMISPKPATAINVRGVSPQGGNPNAPVIPKITSNKSFKKSVNDEDSSKADKNKSADNE